MEIDSHLGCAASGLTSDARTLVDHARVECQNHRFTYNESFPIESCTQSICDLSLKFGEDGDEDAGGMVSPSSKEEEEERLGERKRSTSHPPAHVSPFRSSFHFLGSVGLTRVCT